MGLSFANPAAVWALLGIPVVLAVHFLQTRSQRVETNTLFLLEHLPEDTRKGAVFSRLRSGLQLWMQLLFVCLLTLLLARPMWLRRDSTQNIGVVIDSSASMDAFRDRLTPRLTSVLTPLVRAAGKTTLFVVPSDPALPLLHRGDDVRAALEAISAFRPRSPAHDPRPTLLRLREHIGPEGLLLFVTDHPPEHVPADARVLGIGEPRENSALGGVRFETAPEGGAEALVSIVYYGHQPKQTELRVSGEGINLPPMSIDLRPGAVLTVRLPLPNAISRGLIQLGDDALAIDNTLPFVIPRPKPISWSAVPSLSHLANRVMATIPASSESENASLKWLLYDHAMPEASGTALLFPAKGETLSYALPVPEEHELVRDLSWAGLLGRPRAFAEVLPGDIPLLWMGNAPLILLREGAGRRQLIFTVSPEDSNLEKLPAFVLLVHRFAERFRAESDLPEARQLETRQRLQLPGVNLRHHFRGVDGTNSEGPVPERTPDIPGFLQVWRGVDLRLDAAVQFLDASESDLTRAASTVWPSEIALRRREQNSQTDFLAELWILLLAATILVSWMAEGAPNKKPLGEPRGKKEPRRTVEVESLNRSSKWVRAGSG